MGAASETPGLPGCAALPTLCDHSPPGSSKSSFIKRQVQCQPCLTPQGWHQGCPEARAAEHGDTLAPPSPGCP